MSVYDTLREIVALAEATMNELEDELKLAEDKGYDRGSEDGYTQGQADAEEK